LVRHGLQFVEAARGQGQLQRLLVVPCQLEGHFGADAVRGAGDEMRA
jgi:hypothetical protein